MTTIIKWYGDHQDEMIPVAGPGNWNDPDMVISVNDRQKSWDKFSLLALLGTCQTQIQLHLPNLAPTPPYNVEKYYLQFRLIFKSNAFLKGK